ncbi:hypothetical protein PG985_011119 [Apiospora marii]|uniref:uncharacterized protein n=1 Tax=Apiospora marii TaxID=335849 RepID=UPI0031324E7A
MSIPIGSDPSISQNFGNSSVSSGSRLFQGIVQGDVHLHHQQQEQPKPTILIPFGRDADFIQRGETMAQVHELCARQYSRTALVGLGGVGKSQLAIEYAYQVRERSPETWVFWIYASSAERYLMDLRNIADYAKLRERDDPRADTLRLVSNWLVSESSGSWVIIIDNLDDADFLFQSQNTGHQSRPSLVSYLPTCEKGSILVISRNKDAVLKLVELPNIIQLDPMTPAEAVALAEKKLTVSNCSVERLAGTLEYMPLAIVQAAAYIARMGPRCSVDQYLEKFEQSDHDKAKLLNFDGGQLRRDPEAKNSIIITWQLMFDHIHHTRPSAAHLLSLMSVCSSQVIPEYILQPPVYDPQAPLVIDPCPLREVCKSGDHGTSDEDILLLADCSLISISADGSTYRMHSLVQLATRKWLQAAGNDGHALWQRALMKGLSAALTKWSSEHYYFSTWAQCHTERGQGQEVLPERKGFELTSAVHSLAPQCPHDKSGLAIWAKLQYTLAFFWVTKLHWLPDALHRAEWALISAVFGGLERDSDLVLMAADLVCVIRMTLHLTETYTATALLYDQENTEVQRRVNTPAKCAAWDAMVEKRTGRIRDAQRDFGHEHPHTVNFINQLALLHMSQRNEDEAERLLRPVLESQSWLIRCFWDPTLISLNLHSLISSNHLETEETLELARTMARIYRSSLGLQPTFGDIQERQIVRFVEDGLISIGEALYKALVNIPSDWEPHTTIIGFPSSERMFRLFRNLIIAGTSASHIRSSEIVPLERADAPNFVTTYSVDSASIQWLSNTERGSELPPSSPWLSVYYATRPQ